MDAGSAGERVLPFRFIFPYGAGIFRAEKSHSVGFANDHISGAAIAKRGCDLFARLAFKPKLFEEIHFFLGPLHRVLRRYLLYLRRILHQNTATCKSKNEKPPSWGWAAA
jgi:hypothetical protein